MLVNGAVAGGSTVRAGEGAQPAAAEARSLADTEQIRRALRARYDELTAEYERAVAESQVLRLIEGGDRAGDDAADSGTKSAERETAQSLIMSILERRQQFEHALTRLDEGGYGFCEGCGAPIPVERLQIYPGATSCVTCQRVRERRAA